MSECQFRSTDGRCKKYGRGRGYRCRPTTKEAFEEPVKMIDPRRVCEHSSIFGNSLCYITKEQLMELVKGKAVWFDDGEYGWFLILKKEKE